MVFSSVGSCTEKSFIQLSPFLLSLSYKQESHVGIPPIFFLLISQRGVVKYQINGFFALNKIIMILIFRLLYSVTIFPARGAFFYKNNNNNNIIIIAVYFWPCWDLVSAQVIAIINIKMKQVHLVDQITSEFRDCLYGTQLDNYYIQLTIYKLTFNIQDQNQNFPSLLLYVIVFNVIVEIIVQLFCWTTCLVYLHYPMNYVSCT